MEKEFIRKSTQDNFVTEKVDIVKNNLLGDYNDDGVYCLAPQIVEELIALKKVRKNSFDNSIFCFGNLLGFGEIAFEVEFSKNRDQNNNATSSLYVLEEVDKVNGYLQNTIKTKLADYVSTMDDFIEESYKKFNVVSDDDDEGRERKSLEDLELDDSYILAKKAYMLLLDKLSDEKVLDAYGKYFTARLSTLTKTDNEFCNAVLNSFNQRYELIEEVFLKEKNYKALNELLDACIENVSGTKVDFIDQEKDFNNTMAEYLDAFTDSINTLSDKAEQKAINMLDPEDRTKVTQMNASFENTVAPENAEVTAQNEELSSTLQIEKEISDDFKNPYLYEDVENIQTAENDTNNTDTNTIENSENKVNENNNEQQSNEISEKQDSIINHILSMQGEVEDDISKDFVEDNATFQKMRQNDRLSSITDRLSKLSEDTENIEDSVETTENNEELADNKDSFNTQNSLESNANNEEKEIDVSDENSLNKDRFSKVFDYLERKQDRENGENKESIEHDDDFSM